MGVKNKKGCQIEKRKKSYRHQKQVSNRKTKKMLVPQVIKNKMICNR